MAEIFLFDSNSFITPYQKYYPFDLVPHFWQCLEGEIQKGNIVILDKVYDELAKGHIYDAVTKTSVDDDLAKWVKNCSSLVPLKHKQPDIIQRYAQVVNHISTSGYYNDKALAKWADSSEADPWLIACAMSNDYTVITFEGASGNLSQSNKSSNPKIPDVCKHFGVKCAELFYAMRALSFKMGL